MTISFIQSKNISDYSDILDGLYSDLGPMIAWTVLKWCDIVPKHSYAQLFWEVFLVKDNSNNTIGMCGLYTDNKFPERVWLGYFGILKEYRRFGYASQTLDLLQDKIKEFGFTELYLCTDNDNFGAHKFYEKYGFNLLGLANRLIFDKKINENDVVHADNLVYSLKIS